MVSFISVAVVASGEIVKRSQSSHSAEAHHRRENKAGGGGGERKMAVCSQEHEEKPASWACAHGQVGEGRRGGSRGGFRCEHLDAGRPLPPSRADARAATRRWPS